MPGDYENSVMLKIKPKPILKESTASILKNSRPVFPPTR
jgi:hypothetical protein